MGREVGNLSFKKDNLKMKQIVFILLARSTGKQKYDVYFVVDGVEYDVERNDKIDINTTIEVEKTTVYDED